MAKDTRSLCDSSHRGERAKRESGLDGGLHGLEFECGFLISGIALIRVLFRWVKTHPIGPELPQRSR